ncbi:helix-turn-helix domain-containing protein [Alkalihalobacillus sp. LMS6]|jgi:carbohydrate diacid regulator|uniref:CdaR family transcriptional regulator n=1 Tax=Alkalihalobacillus sp. LMS6 TaxID=2924034 RepID=UPI0020D07CE5|nr:sugar diacid recognition domain-containing protein [Alkalihalobacillus sp. LMS6]UTR06043.1 helix-turn-helix domain-containing protein [Alkalihalobacillus sp. LMS6]
MLTNDIAIEVVEQTTRRLNRHINIMNHNGMILASSDPTRVNQIHDGAVHVLKTGESLTIHKKDRAKWMTAKPGINLPIEFQGTIIGVIGITGNPAEIWEFGELVKMNTEMMITQAHLFEQSEWKQRVRDQLFHELIQENASPQSLTNKAKQATFQLVPPFQVSLIRANAVNMKRSVLLNLLSTIFNEQTTLIGYATVDQVYLLTTAQHSDTVSKKVQKLHALLQQKNVSVHIATGTARDDLSSIASSYQEAKAGLELGKGPVTSFHEIQTRALLREMPSQSQKHYYESILGDLAEKYLDTLEHFFTHNGNIGECAKSMFIHRNSLVYRLKKIHDSTGYDPQRFDDSVPLQIAIWLKRLNEDEIRL